MLGPDSIADGFFVQVVITQAQASLLSAVCAGVAEEGGGTDETVRRELHGLGAFFYDVKTNPQAFPVAGKYARSIKTRKRMLKRAS